MQFRKLPRWVHYALNQEMHKPHFRRRLDRCVAEDQALILQFINKHGLPWQFPVASVREAYDRLGAKQPPDWNTCFLIVTPTSILAAAQTAGIPYMRLPRRTSEKVRREGRPFEFLRVPMDVFQPACEVQDA